MEVRRATLDDREAVLDLLKEFHRESLDEYGELDPSRAIAIMKAMVGRSFILTDKDEVVGVLAGMEEEYILSGEPMFIEKVWFVTESHRKYGMMLIRYVEKWCKENGIKRMVMAHMGNSKTEILSKLYNKLGYELMESHYMKELQA